MRRTFALLLLAAGCAAQAGPERLTALPGFEATGVSSNGKAFTFDQRSLAGAPYVASFVFTRCAGPCPAISGRMAGLQEALPAEVRLVSFSVDPDRDTPPVLAEYAERFGADPDRWWFARMEKAPLYELVYAGFKLTILVDPKAPSGYRSTHSTKLVLVDAAGTIRGYYDSNSEREMSRLKRDALALLKNPEESNA